MWKRVSFKQFFVGPMRSAIWGCFFLILLSTLVFFISSYAIRKDCEVRLLREYSKVEEKITNRMQIYANSMLATRSYLYNIRDSTPQQLNRYIQDIQLLERYPGMKAIGYAEILSKNEFSDHAYRLSQLIPNFSLDQYSLNSDYYAITTSIYPQDLLNQKVLSFDMLSEPLRREAILSAIQTDKPHLTNLVVLTQDTNINPDPISTLLYFPVYKLNDPRLSHSIENASGVIFISLRTTDFFRSTFEDSSIDSEKVGFMVEMTNLGKITKKLYQRFENSNSNNLALVKYFEIYGQKFKLTVFALPSFFTTYDNLFPYSLSLLTLLMCSLVFINIRNNADYASELGKTNNLLNISLHRQKEKEDDLIILNRTLQNMSHTLDTQKIVESFIRGVSDIFENKGKFAIFTTTKNSSDTEFHCDLISSNDDSFFESECSIPKVIYQKIFSTRTDETASTHSVDLSVLVTQPTHKYFGMCSQIQASNFGANAFTAFISTSNEFDEMENVLFEALMKHFNTSIQNSMLLKKVEDSNQSKNAFLANMSHEIRTPLNALMGFSEILIREDIAVNIKKELSANIIRNGQQLTRLVDDILDLSKIEAGKILIEKKRVDTSSLLNEINSIMLMRINQSELQFRIEIESAIPQYVNIDPLRLKQILTNLTGNSIKFTQKGLVRLRVLYENLPRVGPRLIFRVEDTGKGIERDFRNKLFQPFSQADNTSTRTVGGTGLGLAISKRLATEMGGNLSLIFSEKDIGSIFELSIPINELENQAWIKDLTTCEDVQVARSNGNMDHLKLKKVLLVEDSADNQDFFNFFLTQAGGQVTIIDNGLEAVDAANRTNYDIILMDIQIPGIDGKEATRRIRSSGFTGPIVALTAHAMEEEQRSCINAGCDGQISKPVSGEALIVQVSNFIQRSNAASN